MTVTKYSTVPRFIFFQAEDGIRDRDVTGVQTCALPISEELSAKARAGVGALNQSGNICNDETFLIGRSANYNHAEIRLQCGERIIGNFWPGGRNAGNQSRLANVGISDQSHIGEQLEFQAINALLSWTAVFVLARSLMRGSRKPGVAASASATASNDDALIGLREVVNFLSGFIVV